MDEHRGIFVNTGSRYITDRLHYNHAWEVEINARIRRGVQLTAANDSTITVKIIGSAGFHRLSVHWSMPRIKTRSR